ncbi:MAG TPA: DUF3710 domain-containing protein [Nocardioidaceae bacterium]|jgi:hypothetical protein|nr:DUF3710 domain-containing protein [Nocardioidaceae bacterium]
MFRRKKAQEAFTQDETEVEERLGPRANGPWDVAEVTIDDDDQSRVNLGSLLVTPHDGLEVQLQVDEVTGQVASVVLAGPEGAAEVRAFAAPRNGDVWDDVRRTVTAEVAQLGGTATERVGAFGTELEVSLTVELEDGQLAQQISRVVGIPGPRWLLRATFFGRPAVEHRDDGDIETALREVVVVRGGTPVPPGDPLPLTLPPNAQPVGPLPG